MKSKPPRAPMRPFPLLFLMLGAPGLTACATATAPTPGKAIPQSLRTACDRPDPAGVKSIGDLAAFSLRQEAALSICDSRRAAVVAVADAYAARAPLTHWWQGWAATR